MSHSDPLSIYERLANHLFDNLVSEHALLEATSELPSLNENILYELAQLAENKALTEPRLGWAITKVADVAARAQNSNLFVQSMASWYLGRAANHWTQPNRVRVAIRRARRGFMKLKEPGWIAACDWQLNAIPWTRPDFALAAQTLAQALDGLVISGFDEMVPHCRLSLAYAQILLGKYQEAKEAISLSEATFAVLGERVNQARCWLHEASCLRRQGQLDEAQHKLEQALEVFESEHALLDMAKVYYQVALGRLVRTDDLSEAAALFQKAAQLFSMHDLDLWHAQSVNNLGYIYLLSGDLAQADKHFAIARESFLRHGILGLLADNFNDSGKLNLLRGKSTISIEQFKQAEEINEKLGSRLSAAIAIANLGEAYGQLGRYQDALHHLERAADRLRSLNNFFRLGACEKFTALIWKQLGQPVVALGHLDKAAKYHEAANQRALLSSIYNLRASILFAQGDHAAAIDCLETSLDTAAKYGVQPQASLARRLLGEALLQLGQADEALNHIEQAKSSFSGMGMTLEYAASWIALGGCYAHLSERRKALAAYEAALDLSQGAFPEIDWRAQVGLANLAAAEGEIEKAISAYRQALSAFNKVRRNFWQPALAGAYLEAPSEVLGQAIVLVAKAQSPHDALQFIEDYKASTLLRHLVDANNVNGDVQCQEIDDLRAEINLLQAQLSVFLDRTSPIKSALQSQQTRLQLIEKVKQYDALKARIERKNLSNATARLLPPDFNLEVFQKLAGRILGDKWVAVDYYLTDNQLITIVITPDHCQVSVASITNRIKIALEACTVARRNGMTPSTNDLNLLGDLLVPSSIGEYLSTDTYLLVAPHKILHNIPWAALYPGSSRQPLVCTCIPSIIPSLQCLVLLWKRLLSRQSKSRDCGLLVGLSDFNGLRPDLPHVKKEVENLSSQLGPTGKCLIENNATLGKLVEACNEGRESHRKDDRSRFAWMHIASHSFSDVYTGRLSGIVLKDGEIWLDQLRNLAPLPDLVTFSACNSIYSFVYEGDEHVGLPVTCLSAGANRVIGSLWPILDNAAAEFTETFYKYYFDGNHPAQALSLAQRLLIERGVQVKDWASFVCVGAP